jgi:hypothetical protein
MPDQTFTAGQVLTAQNQIDLQTNIGLTFIKAQTIGTTVSSVVVSDAFSADFDAYKIIITGGAPSTTALITCQLGATTTGYYWAHQIVPYSGATSAAQGSNAANFGRVGLGTTGILTGNFDLINPFLAKTTLINYDYVDSRTIGEIGAGAGFLNNTTSYTAFTIAIASGTMTGGTIRVYGYRN